MFFFKPSSTPLRRHGDDFGLRVSHDPRGYVLEVHGELDGLADQLPFHD
jgi:hypothetical protein